MPFPKNLRYAAYAISLLAFAPSSYVNGAEEICCHCRNSSGPFNARQVAGFGNKVCEGACASSGGAWLGTADQHACSIGGPLGNSCPLQIAGGNCQGNNWCRCAMVITVKPGPHKIGEDITAVFVVDNLGSEVAGDGFFRKKIDPGDGGQVLWGDSTTSPLHPGNVNLTHKYSTAGTFTINAAVNGYYKWQDDNANKSCSYRCDAKQSATVTIK